MKKVDLRSDYDQIVSDMLLMQYRIEVFRRRLQVARGSADNCASHRLSDLVDESIDELLGMHSDPLLRDQEAKKWWGK